MRVKNKKSCDRFFKLIKAKKTPSFLGNKNYKENKNRYRERLFSGSFLLKFIK